jgi:GNAT superfamily N-acetyltransferase
MSALSIVVVGEDERSTALFERVRESVGPDTASDGMPWTGTRLLAWRGDQPVARLAFQIAQDLHDTPGASGMVGHYEALDAEAGKTLLQHGCRALAERGAVRVLGPMNGSTWTRYRLALRPTHGTPAEDPPPFLSEPWNPARYPGDFEAAGFSVVAQYESRIDVQLDAEAEDAVTVAERVRAAGIRIRTLDLADFEGELERLFALSRECFAGNLYYTPIDLALFREQYRGIRPLIDPELVLIAETDERPVAFQFAFRDPRSPEPSAPRVIVKTVATSPSCRGLGLGGHMLDLIRRRARQVGAGSVIHALLYERNLSMRMSARHRTEVFRRYALYQWTP